MAQPHTGGIGMMDERGQLERTSAAHLALSEGVRPSSSSPENNLKPRRGRPRLENTRDETAQDVCVITMHLIDLSGAAHRSVSHRETTGRKRIRPRMSSKIE